MKSEEIVKWFVLFIIGVKSVYSIAYYSHLIISHTDETFAKEYDDRILYWKKISEFIFVLCMSILLIYHFYPENGIIQRPILVDKETRLLFLLYGVILIFTAEWTVFFDKDSYFVRMINKFK